MNQPPLFVICEMHANGRLATHLVDFLDHAPPFYICRSCADEAEGLGLTNVRPIQEGAA